MCLPCGISDDQIAILKWAGWGDAIVTVIDGRATNMTGLFIDGQFPQTSARLLPGEHTIDYGIRVGVRGYVWTNREGGTARLDLKAGHVYAVKGGRCFFCFTRKYAAWIEDEATGEVLHGSKTYE